MTFFFIRIVGGGVQLGPFGTSATNWPTVPAPSDYDGEFGGMMIARGNRSILRKPAPVPLCPPHDLTGRGRKPATNRLRYDTAGNDNLKFCYYKCLLRKDPVLGSQFHLTFT
jgi:hypothetical protein